jgi:hypothetical protein
MHTNICFGPCDAEEACEVCRAGGVGVHFLVEVLIVRICTV